MAHTPESNRGSANQWPISTQRGSTDHSACGMLECCDTINLCLSCSEEQIPKAKRHRTGDNGKPEIQQIRHRPDPSTNHRASSTNLVIIGFGCWSTGSKSDRRA